MKNTNAYYQRNKERSWEQAKQCCHQEGGEKKAKSYYENNQKKFQEHPRDKYILKEEKDIKRIYLGNWFRNISDIV